MNKFEYIERIIDTLSPKVSLDTFFETISDGIDDIIRETIAEKSYRFLGGKTYFSLSSDKRQIDIYTEIYYMKLNKEALKQEFSGSFLYSRINSKDRVYFCDMIDEQGYICLDIKQPM